MKQPHLNITSPQHDCAAQRESGGAVSHFDKVLRDICGRGSKPAWLSYMIFFFFKIGNKKQVDGIIITAVLWRWCQGERIKREDGWRRECSRSLGRHEIDSARSARLQREQGERHFSTLAETERHANRQEPQGDRHLQNTS